MQSPAPILTAVAALLLGACGSAAAQPIAASAVVQAVPAESVQIVERLADRAADAVPDLTGLSPAHASTRLADLDLRATLIRFGKGAVTAQWPDPGQPAPADRAVVIWVGTPPQPPAPKPVRGATPPAAQDETAEQDTTAGDPAAPQPPTAEQQPPAPAPGGRTPGLENMVPPPHPPRANIRTLPPAKPGTTLQGRASWYGPGFAGHTTACGGVFDPGQLTLASRELRCGTTVTVTGPSGRSVQATVTDWGPAEWTDRRFDLSQATFAAVAGLGAGVVDVTVEVH